MQWSTEGAKSLAHDQTNAKRISRMVSMEHPRYRQDQSSQPDVDLYASTSSAKGISEFIISSNLNVQVIGS